MSKKQKVLELYYLGKTYKEIREITGVSNGTISYHCSGLPREILGVKQKVFTEINRRKYGSLKTVQKCRGCNKELSGYREKFFCSLQCQQDHYFQERYSLWISNNFIDEFKQSRWYKKAVIHRDGYKCSCCGISSWNNKELGLELEHKDGNSENNSPSNLCILCPNCHSQSPTYKAKNMGKGRHWRKERYRQGKSF